MGMFEKASTEVSDQMRDTVTSYTGVVARGENCNMGSRYPWMHLAKFENPNTIASCGVAELRGKGKSGVTSSITLLLLPPSGNLEANTTPVRARGQPTNTAPLFRGAGRLPGGR